MSLTSFKHGWNPDLPDFRDFSYCKIRRPAIAQPRSDLRVIAPQTRNQADLGCCTGYGSTAATMALVLKDKKPFEAHSPLFAYYNGRVIEGNVDKDCGCQIRDVIKGFADKGISSEALWPYDTSLFSTQPSEESYNYAQEHKIISYYRLGNGACSMLDDVRGCLSEGFPVVFGFTVYDNFMSEAIYHTGILTMPTSDMRMQGGHCVTAFGHDDNKKMFLIQNSWGPDWGQQGYFWMPYGYIESRDLSDDFWTIRIGKGM